MRLIKLFSFVFLFLFSILTFAAPEKPVILAFSAHVQVHKNSELTVTENITVRSYNRIIKRGIYRNFPTKYKGKDGLNYNIGFKVLGVAIDGQPSKYHLKSLSNGVRIYIGEKDKRVGAGVHTYSLSYRVDRELGYFKTHDELYWNVVGGGWPFPVEKADVLVQLPPGAAETIMGTKAFTGKQDSQEAAYTVSKNSKGEVLYSTTRPLNPREQFTIVLGWKKGFVTEPTQWQKTKYILKDNQSLIFMLGGLLTVLIYYLLVWAKVGKDPKKGVVIPLYEPPAGFSPAGLRYVMDMGYDNKVLTAAVINMAVKGYIKIEQTSDKKYVLHKVGKDESTLTAPEKALATKLFESNSTLIELDKENAKTMQAAIKDFRSSLKDEYVGQFFLLNTKYLIIGVLLSVACIVPIFAGGGFGPFIFIVPFFVIFFMAGMFTSLKTKVVSAKSIMGVNIFSMFFILIWLFFMFKDTGLSVGLVAGIFAYLVINMIFYFLLKKPTERGGMVINKARGFKMFLEATEKDRLNFRNPPERTPELFEKYLPYAMALGVDQKWCDQFAKVFAAMKDSGGYHPGWLMGMAYANFSMASFGTDIGSSLNSAIASSSSPPGSSSGFGGGGGAGGGGGGGGGGGW